MTYGDGFINWVETQACLGQAHDAGRSALRAWGLAVSYGLEWVPPASFLEDGKVFFLSWDRGEHHLGAECPGGRVEWFYRNRRTGEAWLHDGPGVPDELAGYFLRLRD